MKLLGRSLLVAFLPALLLLGAVPVAAAPAQETGEKDAAASLSLEAVEVEPAAPAADTLCRLSVKLRNAGTGTATALGFSVRLGGQELAVYGNQLFMQAVPPGATTEVQLYNFWTTETGRSAPADGKLRVEVRLLEATWVTIEKDEEGTEVWTLGDPVPDLPVAREITVPLG